MASGYLDQTKGEEHEEAEILNRFVRNLGLEEDIDLGESFRLLALDCKDLFAL